MEEVNERILNADGASWIKKVKNKSTCFHWNKAAREKIRDQKAVCDIMELVEKEKIGELFVYLETYTNSLSEDGEIEETEELMRYYRNNENSLLPYQSQVSELLEPPEGLEYRGMEQWKTMCGV